MLTKRDYWTITSLILVAALLFQLINLAGSRDSLGGAVRETQSVTQESADARWAGEGGR